MANNKKFIQYTTPRGIAKWPHLSKSDAGQTEYAPAYRVTLEVEPEIMESHKLSNGELLIDALNDLWVDAVNQAKEAKKTTNNCPWKIDEETGNYLLTFKVSAEYTDKKTRMIKDTVLPIYDAKKQLFVPSDGGEIGIGSVIRVNFSPYVYNASGKFGVSMRLKAVQVIDYVPKGGDYGFDIEDDYTSFEVGEF